MYNYRVHHVLLESPAIPGDVFRLELAGVKGLRHAGAHCRVFSRDRPSVQSDCRPIRLETHRAAVRRQYLGSLLVWIETFRRGARQRWKLHLHVAQTRFSTGRRTTWRQSTADTISCTRFSPRFSLRKDCVYLFPESLDTVPLAPTNQSIDRSIDRSINRLIV